MFNPKFVKSMPNVNIYVSGLLLFKISSILANPNFYLLKSSVYDAL